MTFDELWRLNLVQEQGPILSFEKPKVVTARPASRRDRNELELTAEDYEFLSQVGIKP
jgi:hypothetical protein